MVARACIARILPHPPLRPATSIVYTVADPLAPRRRLPDAAGKIRRYRYLHRHRRPDARGERRHHPRAAVAHQGRARHGQDHARRGGGARDRRPPHPVAHQVDHEGEPGALRVRCGGAPARLAARRRPGPRHPQLHRPGKALGSLRLRDVPGPSHRRDRQGGHRVPKRPPPGARPHGVLRLRDEGDDHRDPPARHHHHQQQREGAAGRVPAPLLLPLHPVPGHRDGR